MASYVYSYGASYVTPAVNGSKKYQLGNSMERVYDVAAGSVGVASYVNSVWDTQKAGSDKTHYWQSSPEPDYNGTYYDGPGTWGVHTSGHSALPIGAQAEEEPNYHTESNLWTPPETPHAMDDEFDSSTVDPDWSVYNSTDTASGSFSFGSVDAYDTTFTSGNILRAELNGDSRRSWLIMQPPSGKSFYVTKAYSPPTNLLVIARMRFSQRYDEALSSDSNTGIALIADDGSGLPDVAQDKVGLYLKVGAAGVVRAGLDSVVGGVWSGENTTTDVDQQGQALEYLALHKIGTDVHGWVGTNAGNWIYLGSKSVSAFTVAHVGFYIRAASTSAPGVMVGGADFIRFKETTNFLY